MPTTATRRAVEPALIEHFRLGFANRTLGYRLPNKNRKAGAEIRSKLEALGILRASGHEHFNGSLIIPVIDAQGHVLFAPGLTRGKGGMAPALATGV